MMRRHAFLIALLCSGAPVPPGSVHAATTLEVSSAADAGAGTLRAAIEAANADPSPDPVTITFAIGAGAQSIAPVTALPAITRPVVIDGTSQPGFAGAPLIELRGDGVPAGASGLALSAHDGSVIRGLAINRFARDGSTGGYAIQIAVGSNDHVIAGNHLGTDLAGTAAPGGQRAGVYVRGGNVRVGGDVAADRNVLSGNTDYGVVADAGAGLIVRGNYIGVAADGASRLANNHGIFVLGQATHGLFEDNVIAGNSSTQVTIGNGTSTGHVVRGNHIGVRADGMAVVAGGATGVNINGAPAATVEQNVLGGQSSSAITIANAAADDILIRGNRIGIDASGTIALPVARAILVTFSASGSPAGVTIGGVVPGEGNVVANATQHGIAVVSGFSGNVGQITAPARVAIRGNALFDNAGPGIDLEADGPTPNDGAPDADTGANGLQNTPVLTQVLLSSGATAVFGTLASAPATTFLVDLYVSPAADPSGFGEGATYLTTVETMTDGDGLAAFDALLPELPLGHSLTATATTPDGDTSEFSAAMPVTDDPNATTTTSTTSTTSTSATSSTTSTTSPTTTTSTTTSTSATSSTSSTSTSSSTTTSTSTSSTTVVSTTSTTTPTADTSTTTVVPTTSTTTTTLACPETGIPQVLCLLEGLPPPSCAGVALPKPAVRGLGATRTQLERAMRAPAKRTRRLLRKAAGRMRRVSSGLGKAAARDKLPPVCADEMRAGLDAARGLTQAIVGAP